MIIQLEDFGIFGINGDILPHNLPPEIMSFGKNVRFVDGYMEKFLGHSRVYEPPTVNPLFLMPWVNPSNRAWFYCGTGKIYRIIGTVHTDVTRTSGGDYSASGDAFWQGDIFNGVPILNNVSKVDPPQQWDDSTTKFKNLDNWPTDYFCRVIRSFKDFLVAINIDSPTGEFPNLVKWSSAATAGTVPATWDPTIVSQKAGEFPLSQTPGACLDQLPMGNANLIYKEDSIWSMQFIGGQQVFRFDKLRIKHGILATRCVDTLPDGRHVVWTRGDVIVHDGQTSRSIVKSRFRKALFNSVNQNYIHRCFVRTYEAMDEVWICYVSNDGTAEYPDRALVWNYAEDTLAFRDLPNAAWIAAGVIDETAVSYVFDDIPGIIDVDNADAIIDYEPGVLPGADNLVIVSFVDDHFYKADSTNQFDGVNMLSQLMRTGLTLFGRDRMGKPKCDLTSLKFLQSVYPKMEANGSVDFYFGTQENVSSAVNWRGPYSFDPNTQQRIDVRINGRLLAWRMECSTNITYKFHGLGLDVAPVGKARL